MSGEYIPALQNPDGSTVATPSSGHAAFFIGTDNLLYLKLNDGSVLQFQDGTTIATAAYTLTTPVTVANTTTETTVATYTLAAGFFSVGRTIRITGLGFFSAAAGPTLRVRVYYGATVLLDTTAATSANAINGLLQMRAAITCVTTGATGTVNAEGVVDEKPSGASTSLPMVNTLPVTIDTTTSNALKVTLQWGTASASDTATWTNMIYEAL